MRPSGFDAIKMFKQILMRSSNLLSGANGFGNLQRRTGKTYRIFSEFTLDEVNTKRKESAQEQNLVELHIRVVQNENLSPRKDLKTSF